MDDDGLRRCGVPFRMNSNKKDDPPDPNNSEEFGPVSESSTLGLSSGITMQYLIGPTGDDDDDDVNMEDEHDSIEDDDEKMEKSIGLRDSDDGDDSGGDGDDSGNFKVNANTLGRVVEISPPSFDSLVPRVPNEQDFSRLCISTNTENNSKSTTRTTMKIGIGGNVTNNPTRDSNR